MFTTKLKRYKIISFRYVIFWISKLSNSKKVYSFKISNLYVTTLTLKTLSSIKSYVFIVKKPPSY